mgnify:CR=1 FL=1
MLATIGWCGIFLVVTARELFARSFSRRATARARKIPCELTLMLSPSGRVWVQGLVSIARVDRDGLALFSGATPRVVACLAGACQRALCLAWSGV